jgi:biofilm PGA synthesis N-glycosyltransferase PgaC
MNAASSVSFMELIIWGSLVFLGYTYLGYPLILAMWSWLGRRPVARRPATPKVTIVIAAWNEAERLASRIENCIQQEYPLDRLEIVVVSDGSTDDTEAVVRKFDPSRVRLIKLESRQGKAVALNRGVAAATGELIVFTDARQRFARDAVAKLVSNFADPDVGAVSGELVLQSSLEDAEKEGVGLYWRIEKWIRRKEGEIDSVIGASGAIYAIRRPLFVPLPPGALLDDLLIPMYIAMRGFRITFEREALAFDRVSPDYREEFRRKVRTLTGNYQAATLCADLLKPWWNRLFFQYVSHKLCRLAAPFALIALLLCNLLLMEGWFSYLLLAQAVGYGLAIAGWAMARIGVHERWTAAAFAFCLLNYAALIGAIRFAKRDGTVWRKAS